MHLWTETTSKLNSDKPATRHGVKKYIGSLQQRTEINFVMIMRHEYVIQCNE